METPATLTERHVQAAARIDGTFGRGQEYTRYVRGLRVVGSAAHATIQARNVYLVELDWSNGHLTGGCTCPHAARGAFCKHQVAVGLTVLDNSPPAEAGDAEVTSGEESVLDRLPPAAMRSILLDLMSRHPEVRTLVEVRAAAYGGDPEAASARLTELARDVLRTRGFVDYRRSFDVARDAQDLLDQLEGEVDAGGADVARPALFKALTRLQRITLNGDDSAGVLGDACQRAAQLYARSCREGTPDRTKLARWLVKFRDDSPGWPQLELADFRTAFDDRAMGVYRRAVAALSERHRDKDGFERFELDRMRLELADDDGDVDLAIEILSAGEHPQFGAVIDRLRVAGREDEAVEWTDRAVAAGRVSGHGGGNEYWLSPDAVASTYAEIGRVDDALAVLRAEFRRAPGAARFRALVDFAKPLGVGDREQQWALAAARELAGERFGNGAPLIEIALHSRDLDAAWEAADRFGPGHLWQPLADATAPTDPRRAADLYRPGLEQDLVHADTSKYAGVADRLSTMQTLYNAAGQSAEFEELIAEIRETYWRRTSLMAALDKRRLP